MLRTALIAAAALAGSATLASAQGPLSENPPTETVICLDVNGQTLPVTCTVPSSRLDQREDMCMCREGTRTPVSVCPPGVKAPAESRAFERARREAGRDGTLVGDMFEGRPMCMAPRDPL